MKRMKMILTNQDRRILDRKYSSEPITREGVNFWLSLRVGRSDINLANELYRTPKEQDDWIKKGLEMRLPMPKPMLTTRLKALYHKYF